MADAVHADFALNTYSYTLRGPLGTQLPAFAESGFREVELMMYPGHLWPQDMSSTQIRDLSRQLSALELQVRTINQPNIDINVAAANEAMRHHSLQVLRSAVSLAGELQAEGVVIGPGKANPLLPAPREQLMGHCFRALDELLPHAEACGTRLLMENMPFAFLPDADGMVDALERYGDASIEVVYDVANAHFIGEDLDAGFARVASRLHTIHLSDTFRSLYRHDPVGRGDVDFAAALAAARASRHQRRPVLEIISTQPEGDIDASVRVLADLGWGTLAG
jgi:sugar phosphate isomerase/epimerase